MPTYSYECPKCGATLNAVRPITADDPGYDCKDCESPMRRIFGVGAVTFNGSGFYSKDK